MESKQTNVQVDDMSGKMKEFLKPINLNLSAVQPANIFDSQAADKTSVLKLDGAVECEIRVLLVDGNKESLISTGRMLALNSYQVTMVVSGSIAMKTISNGKKQFDMVIIDVDLPDMDSFELCKKIEKTGILVVVTSTKDDSEVTYKALENGAYILVKKPVDELSMKYLDQSMIKQRIQKNRKGLDGEIGSVENILFGGTQITKSTSIGKKRKYNRKNGIKEGVNGNTNPPNLNGEPTSIHFYNRKKMCIEWTKELHKKFMEAVNKLGEGNCYPKEILELMNIPGLTRMHVASHLQKCRYDNWKSPAERKKQSRNRYFFAPTTIGERGHDKIRVFGSMPQEKVQMNPHLPLFGAEKLQNSAFGNGTLSNFRTPVTYYPEKETASERWIDPSLLWATQGFQIFNPTTHPWTLPPPTFNIVPTMVGNSSTISSSYNSFNMPGDGITQTKEAMNFVPTMKMPDVMTSEFFTGDEEMNFLLPEFPNFSLDNKFENYHRDEVNHLQWMESRVDKVTEHLGNAGIASTSARKVIKDL